MFSRKTKHSVLAVRLKKLWETNKIPGKDAKIYNAAGKRHPARVRVQEPLCDRARGCTAIGRAASMGDGGVAVVWGGDQYILVFGE